MLQFFKAEVTDCSATLQPERDACSVRLLIRCPEMENLLAAWEINRSI